MFPLRDLNFLLCSRDLDILCAQRIMGFLFLITHESTRSEIPITWCEPLTWNSNLDTEDGF